MFNMKYVDSAIKTIEGGKLLKKFDVQVMVSSSSVEVQYDQIVSDIYCSQFNLNVAMILYEKYVSKIWTVSHAYDSNGGWVFNFRRNVKVDDGKNYINLKSVKDIGEAFLLAFLYSIKYN